MKRCEKVIFLYEKGHLSVKMAKFNEKMPFLGEFQYVKDIYERKKFKSVP